MKIKASPLCFEKTSGLCQAVQVCIKDLVASSSNFLEVIAEVMVHPFSWNFEFCFLIKTERWCIAHPKWQLKTIPIQLCRWAAYKKCKSAPKYCTIWTNTVCNVKKNISQIHKNLSTSIRAIDPAVQRIIRQGLWTKYASNYLLKCCWY